MKLNLSQYYLNAPGLKNYATVEIHLNVAFVKSTETFIRNKTIIFIDFEVFNVDDNTMKCVHPHRNPCTVTVGFFCDFPPAFFW